MLLNFTIINLKSQLLHGGYEYLPQKESNG